jgi:ferredoxin
MAEAAQEQPPTGVDVVGLLRSPLRILEEKNLLRLVTDAAFGEDVLCLALTCRALRNAVWAAHPPRPPPTEGDGETAPHAGKRLVSGVGVVAASPARLGWARALGESGPQWLQRWDEGVCERFAAEGRLEALQLARAQGCAWGAQTCSRAADGVVRGVAGTAAVLEYATAHGCHVASTCSGLCCAACYLQQPDQQAPPPPPLATVLDLHRDRFELPPGTAPLWRALAVEVLGEVVAGYGGADNGHGFLSDVVRLRVVRGCDCRRLGAASCEKLPVVWSGMPVGGLVLSGDWCLCSHADTRCTAWSHHTRG